MYVNLGMGVPYSTMVNMLDSDIVASEFKLQSLYYVHFQTNTLGNSMNLFILQAMG